MLKRAKRRVCTYWTQKFLGPYVEKARPVSRPEPADQVFSRCIRDIVISRRVMQKARQGLLDNKAFDNANIFERQAWRILANYCEAQAFVQGEDSL